MTTSEELLLKSGFSQKEVQKLKNNIENHGGSGIEPLNVIYFYV